MKTNIVEGADATIRDKLRDYTHLHHALGCAARSRSPSSTASVSMLGYDHDLDEPVIHWLNDTRRASRRASNNRKKVLC